jgi:carboxyl-terminal processing protease
MIASQARMLVKRLKASWFGAALLAIGASGCMEDPFDFGGPRSCEAPDENVWVYGLMQDAYLWSPEMPDIDPETFESPSDVVTALRVDPDRWSRVSDKAKTDALFEEGKVISFGFATRRDLVGRLVVSYVSHDSPAERAGMKRGDVVDEIGGFTIAQLDDEDRWGDIYGEDMPGVSVDLALTTANDEPQQVTLVKDWVTIDTVPVSGVHDVNGRKIGYLLFSTFVDTAPEDLDAAFTEFEQAGVRDVVVDLRYNGGGRIAVALHLSELLAGDKANGDVGYTVKYGPGLDEQDVSRGLSRIDHRVRDPRRVVFITSHSTLSASELVINIVRPYVDVKIVGDVTGGKPVGSHQWSFCDKIAQPITFRLLNADGVGDYFDGLVPDCVASDDLSHQLGDAEEGALAAALAMADRASCPEQSPSGTDATGPGELGPSRDPVGARLHDLDELAGWF